MITAEQAQEAAELLAEREDLIRPLVLMAEAKSYRIAYGDVEKVGAGGSAYERFNDKGTSKHAPITPTIRKMLQGEIEQQIAAIDEKLRALGVSPPPPTKAEAA